MQGEIVWKIQWAQYAEAAYHGVDMRIRSMIDKRKFTHGASPYRAWQNHIEGTVGERAVYDWVCEPWTPRFETFDTPDLWDDVQIRATGVDRGRLVVHEPPKDNPEWRYVLVTGVGPEFCIRGWLYGHEAQSRQDRWYALDEKQGREAFNMEQHELRSMDSFQIREANLQRMEERDGRAHPDAAA
jgi:hypothetical protein